MSETYGPVQSADDIKTRFYFPGGGVTLCPVLTLTLPNGKVWRFEWHHYLGPTFLRKDDEPLARYPSERNPMWQTFNLWHNQGKRVDAEGNCIWEPETA
jgi:hypothetical protein